MMVKKILSVVFAVVIVMSLLTCTVSAADVTSAPYDSYEYNEFKESIVAPVGYTYSYTLDATRLGLEGELSAPSDITYTGDTIYVLDGNNSRIIAIDENYNFLREYKNFTIGPELAEKYDITVNENGFVTFDGANGLEVTPDGQIYIADTTGNRVFRIGQDCRINLVILRPDDALNDTSVFFAPNRITVDDKGRIYVVSNNIALGVMIFSGDGEFIEFYGANQVLSTTQALVKYFRKVFMNITQLELIEQAVPVTIANMDFADNGFMYTVSPYRDTTANAAVAGLVRKMDYKGDDLINPKAVFGDIIPSSNGRKTWFHDVDIDKDGFINLLDNSRGRVFQYTDSGTLISVFGANSDQAGCFASATALESVGDDILVVDRKKNCIFVYSPTEYVLNVRSAVLKMNNNDFEGSSEEWNSLLKRNSNSYLCYQGLGRIADYQGDYDKAMYYYELAYDQEGYALAFQQKRQDSIEANAIWVVLAAVAVIVLIILLAKYLKRFTVPAEGEAYSKIESKYGMEFYVLLHPIDGFSQFKTRNMPSMIVSAIIAALWLIIKVLDYSFTGFAFSINRNVDFNMPVTILVTVGTYVLFCVANWAICTLLDGKGTIKDIFATTAYSLIPYIVSLAIKIVLTNFLVPSESVFIGIITTIGIIWSAAILILGMLTIHEFSLAKTLWALILTLFGIVAIIFLAILLYSLLNQMFSFFISVYKEVRFRL